MAALIETMITGQVDQAIERHRIRCLRPEVLNAFRQMDSNGDRNLSKQELLQCAEHLPAELKSTLKNVKDE